MCVCVFLLESRVGQWSVIVAFHVPNHLLWFLAGLLCLEALPNYMMRCHITDVPFIDEPGVQQKVRTFKTRVTLRTRTV